MCIRDRGYSSTNYESACGQYEAGYISGCVTSLQYLVQAVKSDGLRYTSAGKVPGIFQITLPEQKAEDTLDELLPVSYTHLTLPTILRV